VRKLLFSVFIVFIVFALFSPQVNLHARTTSEQLDFEIDWIAQNLVTNAEKQARGEPATSREDYARWLSEGVKNSIKHLDSMERFYYVDAWLIGQAGNIDKEHQLSRDMVGYYYRRRVEWVLEQGRGTSEDSALITYYVLQEAHQRALASLEEKGDPYNVKSELERADIRVLSNAEHNTKADETYHFVVWTDRPEEGQVRDANNPATWGENAVVLDGRRGEAFTVEEASGEKYYSGENEKKVSDATVTFDEDRAEDAQWRGRRTGSFSLDNYCFIATAVYGSPGAGEIVVLRRFRDEVLMNSTLGREWVKQYYRSSPPLAAFIARHDILRSGVRVIFIDPLVTTVKWLQQ